MQSAFCVCLNGWSEEEEEEEVEGKELTPRSASWFIEKNYF